MLKYPCLVLDHDDTVVRSEETVNFPCFQIALAQFRPGTTITLAQYYEGCYRYGFADMCRKWYQFTEEELHEEFLGWQSYSCSHTPTPFPGIEEVLQKQKALGGLICVVSHSGAETIARDYETHFGIQPDAIFGWELPEHQRKPNAYPLEQIMHRYRLRPEELLVVDDMKPGAVMAKAAGVACAFAAWGRRDCKELSREMQQVCQYSFDSPLQLHHFLFDGLTAMV